jgi:hypothetical protein
MQTEQPVACAIAYNAPPPPPNPPANVVQQGHQAATILHGESRQPADEEEAFPPPRGFVHMIQRGRPTNKVQKKRAREVFHAEHAPPATPKYLNWSEHLIGFDRSDHPLKVLRLGHHALVLEA